MNRSEALVITAVVALAMVPRFEAGVQQYVTNHRAEIQMAVNHIQGNLPIPFAAPDAVMHQQLAFLSSPGFPMDVQERLDYLPPTIAAARRVRLIGLQARVANLRAVAGMNRAAFIAYSNSAKRCTVPPVPMVPSVEAIPSVSADY